MQEGQGMSSPKSRRGGARRKPESCLPCRKHKLKCNREVPCAACIRYHREEPCLLNPATQQETKNRHIDISARTGTAHRNAQTTLNRGAARSGQHNDREQLGVSGSHTLTEQFRSLVDSGSMYSPSIKLPELLAEASRQGSRSVAWKSILSRETKLEACRSRLASTLPSRSQCDLLVNFYHDHINWLYQTIHVPSFRKEYSAFWDTQFNDVALDWVALLFSIISLSSLHVPLAAVTVVGIPAESIRSLAHIWHEASEYALNGGDCIARPSITQIQNFSVTQLFWYANNQLETLNSRMAQAIRQAQALGLDRNTSESRTLVDEMQHRAWWDLVGSDMFQSICFDRAPMIKLGTPGVPLPLNCNDEDLDTTSIRPKPIEVPTVMSKQIFRARLFQMLMHHYHKSSPFSEHRSYNDACDIDADLLSFLQDLTCYFQVKEGGSFPQLPEPLAEVISWQHHILRTCVSIHRVRIYRPFLGEKRGEPWLRCMEACADALLVYNTLRQNKSASSHHKFSSQAYQIFSVSVTIATLLLVEGQIPVPDAREKILEMAEDLKTLDYHGCDIPIAANGRKVVLRLLEMCDLRAAGSASSEDADQVIPHISGILGGEKHTSTYMRRLPGSKGGSTATPSSSLAMHTGDSPALLPDLNRTQQDESATNIGEIDTLAPENTFHVDINNIMPDIFGNFEGPQDFNVFTWDMSGMLLARMQQ